MNLRDIYCFQVRHIKNILFNYILVLPYAILHIINDITTYFRDNTLF